MVDGGCWRALLPVQTAVLLAESQMRPSAPQAQAAWGTHGFWGSRRSGVGPLPVR